MTTTTVSRGAVRRATYTVDSCSRVLFTVGDDTVTKLVDAPARLYGAAASGLDTPDTYVVEPCLSTGDAKELQALIDDYLQQTAEHGRVPMTFSRLGDYLETLVP